MVILNWAAMLVITFLGGVSKSIAMGTFTSFRLTAVCAIFWLIIEIGEVVNKTTKVVNAVVDGALILPMFVFWFLVSASTL